MSKLTVVIPIVVVAVVAAVVLGVAGWRHFTSGPAIETQVLGVWQEQTSSDPIRLTISEADGSGEATGDATQFWVTMAEASAAPLPARVDGDRILVLDENARDILWTISYDEGADALLLARPDGAERHVLRRVST